MFIAAAGFRAGRPPAHAQWARMAEYMSSRSVAASMLILRLNGFLSATRAWWLDSVTVIFGWWRGVAATRCVESTKLLYGGQG